MNKLLTLLLSICITTGANAESLLKRYLNKLSNPNVDKTHAGLSKIKVGNFYVYKLNTKPTNTTNDIEKQIKQIEHEHVGDGYDPVAIKSALEWQASDDPNKHANPWNSDDVMTDVEGKETDLLYGDGSPLRDEAVAEAWRLAREAEARLKQHREYMRSLSKSRESISNIKENDPKTNQMTSGG
jgi:hypothetical protein